MNKGIKGQLERSNQKIKELVGIYRGAVSRSGITENEFWLWYALVNMDGEYTQQDLCGLWSLSKQTVNTIITHMAQKGYVTLEMIPGTRNRKRILLTEAGRRYGEALVRPVSWGEQRALEQLSEEEWTLCMQVLEKYIRLLKEEINGNENE